MSPWFQTFSKISAYLLGVLWILPLLYAFWAAFHPPEFATQFSLTAPLTLENFVSAWDQAPFFRYMLNTIVITTLILVSQLFLCTLAAYALAREKFAGRGFAFALVLTQLMVMPEVLIVENYRTLARLELVFISSSPPRVPYFSTIITSPITINSVHPRATLNPPPPNFYLDHS